MCGRDISEVRKKKGWTDIQGNSPRHWPLPQSPSDSQQDEGIQRTQEEFFLEQYNPVIAGVCLHLSAVYRDSGYTRRREISKSSPDGSFAAPQGYSWYPTAMCHTNVYSPPAVGPTRAAAGRRFAVLRCGG